MKSLLMAGLIVCGMCGISYGQNVVNYGYGPVIVYPAPVAVTTVPVVVYKPVVVYQPVQVLVPLAQPIPAPVYVVPEVRRNCWHWIRPQPTYYYYQ